MPFAMFEARSRMAHSMMSAAPTLSSRKQTTATPRLSLTIKRLRQRSNDVLKAPGAVHTRLVRTLTSARPHYPRHFRSRRVDRLGVRFRDRRAGAAQCQQHCRLRTAAVWWVDGQGTSCSWPTVGPMPAPAISKVTLTSSCLVPNNGSGVHLAVAGWRCGTDSR
jgi:hypothetical protein